jgi:hypothetical protein
LFTRSTREVPLVDAASPWCGKEAISLPAL